MTRSTILKSASLIALAATLSAAPASAQNACDLNGVAQAPPVGADSLYCGTIQGDFGGANVTLIGNGIFNGGGENTAVGANAFTISDPFLNLFAGAILGYLPPATMGATAIGAYAYALGNGSVAVGDQAGVGIATIPGDGSVTILSVDNGTAIGSHAVVTGVNGTAVGMSAQATGLSSTAIGQNAQASGSGSVAIGVDATASSGFATAIGLDANATGSHATALGGQSDATGTDSLAIGYNADALHNNSVAIGANTVTTADNQVNVGSRTVSGVTAGAVSAVSTDAVNGSQLFATNANVAANTTAIGALQTSSTAQNTAITAIQTVNTTQATQITALQAADTAIDGRVDALEAIAFDFTDELDRLDGRIDSVDDRASAGSAVAIALGGAAFLPDKQFNLTGNVGMYRGAYAAALQFGAMISPSAAFNAGIATGFNKGGKVGARAGVTFGW